jgi:hypothetical protein
MTANELDAALADARAAILIAADPAGAAPDRRAGHRAHPRREPQRLRR